MVVAKRFACDVRGEKQPARVVDREAPAVAGDRGDTHVSRARVGAAEVEEPAQANAAPALGRVEASRAVECRDELIRCGELGERQHERACRQALDAQAVGRRVDRSGIVGHPRGAREGVAGERLCLV